jgi:hypothetical protein
LKWDWPEWPAVGRELAKLPGVRRDQIQHEGRRLTVYEISSTDTVVDLAEEKLRKRAAGPARDGLRLRSTTALRPRSTAAPGIVGNVEDTQRDPEGNVATANTPPAILLSIVVALNPTISGCLAVSVVVTLRQPPIAIIIVTAATIIVVVFGAVVIGPGVVPPAVRIVVIVVRRAARTDRQRQQR